MAKPNSTGQYAVDVIEGDAVETLPRGRRSEHDPVFVDALRTVPVGKAGRLTSMAVDPTNAAAKAKVASIIRKHAEIAWGDGACKVNWTAQGVPQATRTR